MVRRAALGSFEERDDVRIDELIADASALFVPSHDSGSLQDAEMLRDVLLCRLERADQFLDGNCLGRKAVEQLDAQRLGPARVDALRSSPLVGL